MSGAGAAVIAATEIGRGGLFKLVFPTIADILRRVIPDKEQAERAALELERSDAMQSFQLLLAQIELNKTEAASGNVWVSGWRPAFGWAGAAGFAVHLVVLPIVGYAAALFGYTLPPIPAVDPLVWGTATGLLGLNFGARTFEKLKGAA